MRAPRQIAFTLLAAALGLVALEAGARLIEGAHPPRPLPTLDASDCMPDCLPGAAAIPIRGAEGLPGLRMGRHETRGWALTPGAAARDVWVAGERIVRDGRHADAERIVAEARAAMAALPEG